MIQTRVDATSEPPQTRGNGQDVNMCSIAQLFPSRASFTRIISGLAICLFSGQVFAQGSLVWSDEFDGTSLDTSKWEPMIGDGCSYGVCGWGNNEWEWYTNRNENVYVEDGYLHIVAREDWWNGHQYTSARLRTENKADFRYGRLEARIKLPRGQGIWPAFWMLPTDSPYGGWPRSGEIDILETVNNENAVHGTIHFGDPKDQAGGTHYPGVDIGATFNVYAIEWEPDEIRWYFNDVMYARVTEDRWYSSSSDDFGAPFNQQFHFLLNVAVGGNWPGYPDGSTQFPQEMVVDYVRVYDLCDACPYYENPLGIPGQIEAEDYDYGGQGVSYNDADAQNQGGEYRNDGVDIEEATERGYNIGWITPNEWIEYSVNVLTDGRYKLEIGVASTGTSGLFHLELDGQDITGPLAVPNTGGWQVWGTIEMFIELTTPGEQRLRFVNEAGSSSYNFNYIDFTLGPDVDQDFDVDLADLISMMFCMSGPDVLSPVEPACSGTPFMDSDVDFDNDSDIKDLYEMQRSYTGN
jgi:beta-glucanase (GH16 family)